MKKRLKKLSVYLKKKNKFILQDPVTFEEKFALSISKRYTIIVSLFLILFFSFLVYLVISFTSLKRFIPGFPKNASELYEINSRNEQKLLEFETKNKNRDLWIANLQSILSDEDSIGINDIKNIIEKDSTKDYKSILFQRSKEDSILREKVDRYNSTNKTNIVRSILISVLKFEMPHKGKLISFKRGSLHEAKFKASFKSNVKTAMEGVVISKSKNQLVLQHENNIVSVYSNFSDIKPKIGDQLSKGKKIGVVKDSVFKFQLWYKGETIPVETYRDL